MTSSERAAARASDKSDELIRESEALRRELLEKVDKLESLCAELQAAVDLREVHRP